MFHPEFYIQAWEGAIGGELTEMWDILNTLSADHKQHFQMILEKHTYILQVFIGTMQTNLINLHAVAFIYAFC